MKITAITAQKRNPNRCSIFIDEEYACSLTIDEIQDKKLRIGMSLDASERKKLERASEDSLLYARALDKALRRPHSKREIEIYLRKKHVDDATIDKIISKLVQKKYVDDEHFAEYWIEIRQRRYKSIKEIRSELYSKGITSSQIEELISDTEDSEAIARLIQSKRHKYPDEKKLIAYLARKGFSYSEIKEAMKISED